MSIFACTSNTLKDPSKILFIEKSYRCNSIKECFKQLIWQKVTLVLVEYRGGFKVGLGWRPSAPLDRYMELIVITAVDSGWFLHQKCVTTYWKSVNKVCIWILNCHTKNKYKFEAFWFVFKFFCYTIFTNFPKKIGGGGKQKRAKLSHIARLILSLLPSPANAEYVFSNAGYLSTNRRNMFSMRTLKLRLMAS